MQHLHERRERVPAACSGSFLRREIPHYPPSHWPELANRRVTDRGTRNHQSFYFRKLYFGHSRTYLQEPALLRSGGVLSCLTATRFSSLGPLSLPLLSFFYRRWAPWRKPRPLRQAQASQRLPHPRTAGCTCASSARTLKARPSASTSPSNWPKSFCLPSTRTASMTARSRSITLI